MCKSLGYKFHITIKKRSPIHWLIAFFLLVTGINKRYMTDFYTIIFNFLSVPRVKDRKEIKSPWGMTEEKVALIAHEGRHLQQRKEVGLLKHTYRYLTSQRARAEIEVDAYITSMYTYFLIGTKYQAYHYVREIRNILLGYGIKKPEILEWAHTEMLRNYNNMEEGILREEDLNLATFLYTQGYSD